MTRPSPGVAVVVGFVGTLLLALLVDTARQVGEVRAITAIVGGIAVAWVVDRVGNNLANAYDLGGIRLALSRLIPTRMTSEYRINWSDTSGQTSFVKERSTWWLWRGRVFGQCTRRDESAV